MFLHLITFLQTVKNNPPLFSPRASLSINPFNKKSKENSFKRNNAMQNLLTFSLHSTDLHCQGCLMKYLKGRTFTRKVQCHIHLFLLSGFTKESTADPFECHRDSNITNVSGLLLPTDNYSKW